MITGLTPNTSYTYTVKAYNVAGSSAGTSKTFRTQPDTNISKSIITSPNNNARVSANTDITLRWENHGATRNNLYIVARVNGANHPVYAGSISGTSKVFRLPAGLISVTVRIFSYNGSQSLGYSLINLRPEN